MKKRLLLENVDRHLGERGRKEAKGSSVWRGQRGGGGGGGGGRGRAKRGGEGTRQAREDQREERERERERERGRERGRGGGRYGGPQTAAGVQSAACRLATDAAVGLNTHATDTHTPEECMRHAQAAVHGHTHTGRAPERKYSRPPSLRSHGEQHVLW